MARQWLNSKLNQGFIPKQGMTLDEFDAILSIDSREWINLAQQL
jgi:hypothetical protein